MDTDLLLGLLRGVVRRRPPPRLVAMSHLLLTTHCLLPLLTTHYLLMTTYYPLLTMCRPQLRLIIMSATIDLHLFSAFFDDAPTLTVPGRLFPVTVHYATPEAPRGERRAWRDEGGEAEDAAAAAAAAASEAGAGAETVLPHGRRMLPSRARELLGPKAYLTLLQRIDAQCAAHSNPDPDPNRNRNPNPNPNPNPDPNPNPNPNQVPRLREQAAQHLLVQRALSAEAAQVRR